MPSSVRPPKITSGISDQIEHLVIGEPIPSSSAVTTAQIVSTMKRGENGSISVSMESLGRCMPRLMRLSNPAPA